MTPILSKGKTAIDGLSGAQVAMLRLSRPQTIPATTKSAPATNIATRFQRSGFSLLDDPKWEQLADGINEDTISDLSRFKDFIESVFQVHAVDAQGNVVVRRQLRRRYVLAFVSG